jgi:hypothetical protein
VLLAKKYTLKRNVVRAEGRPASSGTSGGSIKATTETPAASADKEALEKEGAKEDAGQANGGGIPVEAGEKNEPAATLAVGGDSSTN